ncbi:hypothetical protein EC968_004855 [Mortierella alpina]|nr:hypothetical protein EC968_004855 [Mortierella alpina]
MAIIKSPTRTLGASKGRSRTSNRSPETMVSSVPRETGHHEPSPRSGSDSGSTTQPRLLRHSSLPSLPLSEQAPASATDLWQQQQHQPAVQGQEHFPEPQSVETRQSPLTGASNGKEPLQPHVPGLHHQPQHQEMMQLDQSRGTCSEPEIQQRDSNSKQLTQVGQMIRAVPVPGPGPGIQSLKGTDGAPSGHATPLLRRAQSERLEATRLYQVASQRLQQAKEREEAIQFEQEMQTLRNYGDSDNSSSSSNVRHSGSEEGHLDREVSVFHRLPASMQPPQRRGENERQSQQHKSLAASKWTRELLLTPRRGTPSSVDTPERPRDRDTLKQSKGNAEVPDQEAQAQWNSESSLLAWLEQGRRTISRTGTPHRHPSSPGIKVKSEEREAGHFAALKDERDGGDRQQYRDYIVPIEIPSSVGSESGFGSNTSPKKRWRRPTPLPPSTGLRHSQSSPKLSTSPAAAGTSREAHRSSRSVPPRPRPTTSHVHRPRPYPPNANPPQPTMHRQQSTQTSPQGPQLFSKRFIDRLGSYPAVIFYTHIDHIENYYQQPHEHHIHQGDTDTMEAESSSQDAEQPMEQDGDDEVQPRGESPMM